MVYVLKGIVVYIYLMYVYFKNDGFLINFLCLLNLLK